MPWHGLRSSGQHPTRRRSIGRYLAGLGLIAVAAGVVGAARPDPVRYPRPASTFELGIAPERARVTLGVRSPTGRASRLTLSAGDEQTSFVHGGGTVAYDVDIATRAAADGRFRVTADPPAGVVVDPRPTGGPTRRPRLVWAPQPPTLRLPAPVDAGPGRPDAEASVDETDVYGLRLFGVPVRAEPRVAAAAVSTVSHGDRLRATCWATGDHVTNGFAGYPVGTPYGSDVWFLVDTPGGPGFIPDVRFARRGLSDQLGLAPCP